MVGRLGEHVEGLMAEGRYEEGAGMLGRVLQSDWATQNVWDDDVYCRLRLMRYACKHRAAGGGDGEHVARMAVVVVPTSQGKLPSSFTEDDPVEAGQSFSEGRLGEVLSALRKAFALFSESFLAMTRGAVRWELLLEPPHVLHGSCLHPRTLKRELQSATNPTRVIAQPDLGECGDVSAFMDRLEASTPIQAWLVVWPGLQPPSEYMCTCGGVTATGRQGRPVYMSDGSMLDHPPYWGAEWLHHETFHVMEHLFPEAPFAKLSEEVSHPCFLRNRWPDGYRGHYEW
jgi:hypothetical protein